ncbi:MAG: hypothetical protein H0W81_07475 [Chloroflexi bacterium]|nr:hypothetical protein [Chloroflexota bacterium]
MPADLGQTGRAALLGVPLAGVCSDCMRAGAVWRQMRAENHRRREHLAAWYATGRPSGSSAIYPIALMPSCLQVVAHLNPLTYQVDALRRLMVVGGSATFPIGLDFGVLTLALVGLLAIAARLYPRLPM